MSLSTPTPAKRFRLGVVCAKSMDDTSFLDDLIGPNVEAISHLLTNGANPLIPAFALERGIPFTVYPIGSRGLPASTRDIVDGSDFVYVIATSESKSANQAAAICEKAIGPREAEGRPFSWRRVEHEPVLTHRAKLGRICEILACMDRSELKDSAWASAVWREVDA